MQGFGIEIRKAGSLSGLYKDVDTVLKGVTNTDGSVSRDMQAHTVAHSLHKMLKSDATFYCTTIKDCAKVCQICIPKERQDIYHAIHCLKWSEMTQEYRQMVVAMILDDFRVVLNPQNGQ